MAKGKKTTPKNKGGRPTVITPEVEAAILSALRVGGHLKVAAKAAGISDRTLRLHRKTDKGFCRRVNKAISDGENSLINKIYSSDHWQSAAWILERRHNDRWGKKDKVDVTSAGMPLQVVDRETWDEV